MSFVNAGRAIWKISMEYGLKNLPQNMMQAIIDARTRNTQIQEGDILYSEGKVRKLQISYYPPVCNDDGDCTDNVCGDAVQQSLQQMLFQPKQCTASSVYQLNKDSVRLVDGEWNFGDHAKAQMLRALVQVRARMATQMAGLLVSHVGVLPDGSQTRRLPWVNTQTGVAQPAGMDEIARNFYDVAVTDPFIVGGQPVWQWESSVERGGLDAQGQYINKARKAPMYYDTLINTTFNNGTENVIAFDPEMIKFVAYNEHAGIFKTRDYQLEDIDKMFTFGSPERIEGTMPDPFTGLLWDLDIRYDDTLDNCRGAWKFQIRLNWDIFFMPPEICLNGYTGIFHYTTCPPLEVTCPTGSPVLPGNSRIYSASASGLSYPLTLNTLVVAGVTSQPSENEPVIVANIAELATQLNAAAPAGYTFSTSGSNLRYTGYAPISVTINGGTPLTFS